MLSFRDQLRALQAHPGVRAVVAAGRDGLLIDHAGASAAPDGVDAEHAAAAEDETAFAEHLAALAPGLVAAADMLADAHGGGGLRSVVVESADGLLVALPVTPDVTVVAAIDAAHEAAAHAIGRVRGERNALAGAV
ncbi:hypothetical protein tb265_27710 [Gemmatimonadetes bacterium T265]|nr:hypothetical protein tb265_27710 [Gemmatimonadetes bacterium T265]